MSVLQSVQASAPEVNWEKIRSEFPILDQKVNGHPLVYLDSAASSQKPRAVIDVLKSYYEHDNANVHRGLHELSSRATDGYEGARAKVAKYLNAASADEIVFTRGTTEGINLVAQTWGPLNLGADDVILLTEMEHHSNLVPWQLLAARTGARLRFVPICEDGTLNMEAFQSMLTKEVKIFSFVHISNSLGTMNPARELCRLAREAGVITLVDAAQSAGHIPLDVQDIGCDFLAFSGHKMCAPTGIGALYGRFELLDSLPPWHGGGEMIVSVSYQSSSFKPAPHKFEAGTPNIAGAIGLGAAIDYIESIGRAQIFAHDKELTSYAWQKLRDLPGMHLIGPETNRGGLVTFVMDAAHPHDLTTYVNEYGVALRGGHHCTQPLMKKLRLPGTTRASFYFYNTKAEVDRLCEVLEAARKFFS